MSEVWLAARVGLGMFVGSILYALPTDHWSDVVPALLFGSTGAWCALKFRHSRTESGTGQTVHDG